MADKNINPHLKKGAFAQNETSVSTLAQRILAGETSALAQGITLVESNSSKDEVKATQLFNLIKPDYVKNPSWRIAISGSPGVGKSTIIEALISENKEEKFAVLTIDPSSEDSKGSILGDKTRMESIGMMDNVFVRPSPSKNFLGGVSSKTREVMLLCEAAGYNHILIETVGVGQSETLVSKMVDLFILLVLPGSGDEIQGIKRGIVELADMVVVTKADGDRVTVAKQSASAYKNALHILKGKYQNKSIPTIAISSLERQGIEKLWEEINKYKDYFNRENSINKSRKIQVGQWYDDQLKQAIYKKFLQDPAVQKNLKKHEKMIEEGAVDVWNLLSDL